MMRKLIPGIIALVLCTQAAAVDVTRHPIPNSKFPISAAVEVPAGSTLVFLSGVVPTAIDAKAAKDSVAAYGDTKTQTVSVLKSIQAQLAGMHLKMGDIVKMQVFLAGDPAKGGKMDFEGFMAAYTQYFGTTDQPNLPARSTVQVVSLVAPGMLVEIEIQLAK